MRSRSRTSPGSPARVSRLPTGSSAGSNRMPIDHQPNTRSALAGAPLAARRGRGLSPTRHVLPNGLTVLAKETRTTPAVTIHAGFHAGTAYDPRDCAGLAHFVSKTIDRGTESRSADQIAEELDMGGVSLTVAVNRHAMWLVCTCLTEDFERMLALVGDIAIRPTFPRTKSRRAAAKSSPCCARTRTIPPPSPWKR